MSADAPSNRKWKIALVAAIVAGPVLGALSGAWAAQTFPDVPPNNLFYDEIEWGAAHDVINGYTNGNFGPNDEVTRAQAAAFLSHYNDAIHDVVKVVNSPGAQGLHQLTARCPAGERAIAGGGSISEQNMLITDSEMDGRDYRVTWETENNVAINPLQISVTAICAPDPAG